MRSVSRLSQLKTLMAKQSDKSLRDELDSLVDLLKQVGLAPRVVLCQGHCLRGVCPRLVRPSSAIFLAGPGARGQLDTECSVTALLKRHISMA